MTTALDIIKRTMRLLGVYPSGEEPSPEEASDALSTLNDVMDEASNTPLVYAKTLDTITLSANVASITVGSSGTTVTTRPVKVLDESYITIGDQTYELRVATLQEYNDISDKASPGIPEILYAQMDMPDVTLTLWPVPSQAMTLKLWSTKVITSFPALTTVVSLPPGYKNLLAYLLAEAIAPEYEVSLSPEVAAGVRRARNTLETANWEVPMLTLPPELLQTRFNILTGTS